MWKGGDARLTRKCTALVLASMAVLIAIAALVVLREPLLERWYLWRLESSDREVRIQAMLALTRKEEPQGDLSATRDRSF